MDNSRKGSSFEGKYYSALTHFHGGFRVRAEFTYDVKGQSLGMKVYPGYNAAYRKKAGIKKFKYFRTRTAPKQEFTTTLIFLFRVDKQILSLASIFLI